MLSALLSRLVILVFGTLYPAYASYKAVKTKNVREYVRWMMYWIVFAFFTCAEAFADIFLAFWFPFYYELKVLVVIWLLSPLTRGSSLLYRKFVHPMISKHEREIDEYVIRLRREGYHAVVQLGWRGFNLATQLLRHTHLAIQQGNLGGPLRRSYSLGDVQRESSGRQLPPAYEGSGSNVPNAIRELDEMLNAELCDDQTDAPFMDASPQSSPEERRRVITTTREGSDGHSRLARPSLRRSKEGSRQRDSAALSNIISDDSETETDNASPPSSRRDDFSSGYSSSIAVTDAPPPPLPPKSTTNLPRSKPPSSESLQTYEDSLPPRTARTRKGTATSTSKTATKKPTHHDKRK